MTNQFQITLEDGQTFTIPNRVIASLGEPAVNIPGDDTQLRVTRTGVVLANDDGNTAVQVTGNNATISNSGRISGDFNGISSSGNGLNLTNRGTILSDSRAVDLSNGDGLIINNFGNIRGTGDQRNGTFYVNGVVDDATITNRSRGRIDAGIGSIGDGISVQVGSSSEDAINENIDITNRGVIFGRGQADFDGGRSTANGSSGLRFFNGSGETEAIVTGSIRNSGLISAEVNQGFLGGLIVEDGVSYQGTITNERNGRITGPRNGLYIGNANHDLTINNRGLIASGSRALNLDGDNITVNNAGRIIGTDSQRNGTLYVDGTGDNITINNQRGGRINPQTGSSGSGISVQVGTANGLGEGSDDLETSVNINNQGSIQGRGNENVPAGIRFFVGSGLEQATFTGNITNGRNGVITSAQDAGILIESGVEFEGNIVNNGTIRGGNGLAIDAVGASGNIEVINNGRLVGGVNLGDGDDILRQNSNQGVNVNGFGGDDLIFGGQGRDRITGGSGSDTFGFNLNSGRDIITDFETVDTLDVQNIFDNVEQILGVNGAATQVGNNVAIDFGGGNSVTLENFELGNLSADNFLIG